MRKSVLITGSNRGLGKELALVFANNNYDVILHGRDKKELKKVKEQISKIGVNCDSVSGDLNSNKTIEELEKISKDKNISVLVNNAGAQCPYLPLDKLNDEQISEMINTNLIAPIKLTKRIYKHFIKEGTGTVININSQSGLTNSKLRSIYSASKWGLRGFSDTFRSEAKEHNVRIIDVYPSRIKTLPQFDKGMEPCDVAEKIYEAFRTKRTEKIILDEGKDK